MQNVSNITQANYSFEMIKLNNLDIQIEDDNRNGRQYLLLKFHISF